MKPKKLKQKSQKTKKLDASILRLLQERIKISQQLQGRSDEENALRAIYREVDSISRNAQKPIEVACLGPEGSYSHQAAVERFGSLAKYTFCRSIPEVFSAISREQVDTGMVPVENSIEGGVNATMDCLIHTDLVIQGESRLKIHNFLCASKSHKPIKRIYSHPQPLGQCRQWLLTHYPKVEQIEVASTSEGARRVLKDKSAAAIVSPLAAQLYKLKIIGRNISDSLENTTRFLILGEYPSKCTVKSKTSLIFALGNEVGALSSLLDIFASCGLNLDKIESRPAPHKPWEYLFFVDVAGHNQSKSFMRALQQAKKKTLWLKILGSYPTYV